MSKKTPKTDLGAKPRLEIGGTWRAGATHWRGKEKKSLTSRELISNGVNIFRDCRGLFAGLAMTFLDRFLDSASLRSG